MVYPGDCLEFLKHVPDEALQLVVTSPPYNLGKEYERRLNVQNDLEYQRRECTPPVRDRCEGLPWQILSRMRFWMSSQTDTGV